MRLFVLTGLGLAWIAVVGIAQSAENPILERSPETMNRVQLLRSGSDSLEHRREMIADSQRLLWITVPFWEKDQSGTELIQRIKAKQAELQDQTWSLEILQGWIAKFFSEGEKYLKSQLKGVVHYWNAPWWQRNFSFKLKRGHIHDKFFISDDKMILGGRNIGDGYFMPSRETPGFFDLDLRIDGPAARIAAQNQLKLRVLGDYLASSAHFPPFKKQEIQAAQSFFYDNVEDHDFQTASAQGPVKNRVHIPIRAALADPKLFPPQDEAGMRGAVTPVKLLHDNPLYDRDLKTGERFSKTFLTMQNLARSARSIRIFTPYATFDPEMVQWLKEVAKSGIAVSIVTNSVETNDMGESSYKGAASHYLELLEAGVRIGEWQGHSSRIRLEDQEGCKVAPDQWPGHTLHAKVVLFDESVFLLGSNNLNSQSLRRNSEVMAQVRDADLARQVAQVFDEVARDETWVDCGGRQRNLNSRQVVWIDVQQAQAIWKKLKITGPTYDYPWGN